MLLIHFRHRQTSLCESSHLLLENDFPGPREVVGLMIHLIAIAGTTMEDEHRSVLGPFAKPCVPQVDPRGEIQILALVTVDKGSGLGQPFPPDQ